MIDAKTGNEVYSGKWDGVLPDAMLCLGTNDDLQDALFDTFSPCSSCQRSSSAKHIECRGETGCAYGYMGDGKLLPSEYVDGGY